VVIIDEAAQCVEPETLIPLQYGSQKIILVGDPKQLDATVLSASAAKGGLKLSLFSRLHERLKAAQRVFILTEQVHDVFSFRFFRSHWQYRMHAEINRYPSARFYDGLLVPAPSILTRPEPPFRLPFGQRVLVRRCD
jgi:senataxin